MKKTLIALAAVAATTGAMAQATVSGAFGYEVKNTDGATTANIYDAIVNLSVSEDLGNGMKLSASTQVNAFGGRHNTVVGEDATVTLSGAFGSVTVGDYESPNGIIGRAYADAPVIGADTRSTGAAPVTYHALDGDSTIDTKGAAASGVLAAPANYYAFAYKTPAFNGITLGVSGTSATNSLDSLNATGTSGVSYILSASYAAGGLSAGVDYNEASERVRMSASYDFGFAKVGAGTSIGEKLVKATTVYSDTEGNGTTYVIGTEVADTYALGVSVPMGNLLVGATYSKRETGEASIEAAARYTLTKRTSLTAAYQNNNAASNLDDVVRVRLSHSF